MGNSTSAYPAAGGAQVQPSASSSNSGYPGAKVSAPVYAPPPGYNSPYINQNYAQQPFGTAQNVSTPTPQQQQCPSYVGQPVTSYPGQVDYSYPPQPAQYYPPQFAQPYPGQPNQPYPSQPNQSYPGQPGQSYPGKPLFYPAQSMQTYPGQPVQSYPGQPYPGQPQPQQQQQQQQPQTYPGQYSQGYPVQPVQAYPGQPVQAYPSTQNSFAPQPFGAYPGQNSNSNGAPYPYANSSSQPSNTSTNTSTPTAASNAVAASSQHYPDLPPIAFDNLTSNPKLDQEQHHVIGIPTFLVKTGLAGIPDAPSNPNLVAMDGPTFEAFLSDLKKLSTASEKETFIRQKAAQNLFSCKQIKFIIKDIDSQAGKRTAALGLYHVCSNRAFYENIVLSELDPEDRKNLKEMLHLNQ